MKYHFNQIWLVASQELRDQMRDWRIIFPMIALTVFFPFLMIVTARFTMDFVNKYGAGLVGERMVPFLLMVVGFFPVTVALVVALEAFVGEKERGTIEPLLSSPLADWLCQDDRRRIPRFLCSGLWYPIRFKKSQDRTTT